MGMLGRTRLRSSHLSQPLQHMQRRAYAGPSPFPVPSRTSLFRPLNFLAALIPVFTFTLGVWQVKRLKWKNNLIDEIQRNIEREPILLPESIKWV